MSELIKNEPIKSESQQKEVVEEEFDPIEAIKEMKQNYVPKKEYEKVVKEKNDYFKALVNGDTFEAKPEEPVDINQLRKDLFSDNSSLTNLDFIKKSLKLRDEIINREGKDPFCPYGKHISPDDSYYINSQKVADGLQHCIDVADGNPDIFRQELYRITVDNVPRSVINKKIKR